VKTGSALLWGANRKENLTLARESRSEKDGAWLFENPDLEDVRAISQFSSCPALCRASTSYFLVSATKDVDGRDKPGHDD